MSTAAVSTNRLEVLPNEIMISILSNFFLTLELLAVTSTSRRLHSLILRIIHARLIAVSTLPDQTLIFECFHPSSKLFTPYLLCEFLGASPLSPQDSSSNEDDEDQLSLGKLRSWYSRFLPLKPESDYRTPRPHPAGGWLDMSPYSNALVNEDHTSLVCQNMHFDSHELFSQLCTVINFVKIGPRRGLFLSSVNIAEGFMRVWRDWLKERSEGDGRDLDGLLWADAGENVGLRVNVIDRTDASTGTLIWRYEDEATMYTLQYEELVIRTSHLLLKVEQSLNQEATNSGKAMVIGSWDQ